MIHVGKTARELREALGLTQVELAEMLDISSVYVSKIENEKSFPTRQIIDRYQEKFGVDLYIFAWCRHGDLEKLPSSIRKSAIELANAWEKRFEKIVGNLGKATD